MTIVRFDSNKHALERYAFTFAPDPKGIVTFEDMPKRQCKMRFLIAGEPEIGDYRKFRMLPEDAALCVGNAKKRLSVQPKGGIPLLFEHGWGPEGGRAGGYALDVYEENGDIWFLVLLDEPTWAAAVDPGMNWFGRSAGFSGWSDPDGYIRPADIFEGSLTNFPAMNGLGAVEPMSELEQRFSQRTAVAMQRLSSGLLIPTNTQPTSPAEASDRKERETDMKLSAKALKLLGFAENADPTPEQIETALAAKEAAPAPPQADKPMTKSEMLAMMEEIRQQDRTSLTAELRAEFERTAKERDIDSVLLKHEQAGRITAAEREEYRTLGRNIGPEQLDKTLAKFSVSAPTTRVFEPGYGTATETIDSSVSGSIEKMCADTSKVYQYARRNGVTFEAAKSALGIN